MLFLIKFFVALLSSGAYRNGYYAYHTKIDPPSISHFETIFLSNETALYVFIASAIVSLGLSIFLIYMYYMEIEMKTEQTGHILFLSVLIVASLHFSAPKVIVYAFAEMIIASIVALFLFGAKRDRN